VQIEPTAASAAARRDWKPALQLPAMPASRIEGVGLKSPWHHLGLA
jgi:hypothetical protein